MNNPFELIEARLEVIETVLFRIQDSLSGSHTSIESQADKLLTVKQAAEFLNLTVPTLYGKVHRREIPFMKRSKRLYFSQESLMEYIKKGRVPALDEIAEIAEQHLTNNKKGK